MPSKKQKDAEKALLAAHLAEQEAHAQHNLALAPVKSYISTLLATCTSNAVQMSHTEKCESASRLLVSRIFIADAKKMIGFVNGVGFNVDYGDINCSFTSEIENEPNTIKIDRMATSTISNNLPSPTKHSKFHPNENDDDVFSTSTPTKSPKPSTQSKFQRQISNLSTSSNISSSSGLKTAYTLSELGLGSLLKHVDHERFNIGRISDYFWGIWLMSKSGLEYLNLKEREENVNANTNANNIIDGVDTTPTTSPRPTSNNGNNSSPRRSPKSTLRTNLDEPITSIKLKINATITIDELYKFLTLQGQTRTALTKKQDLYLYLETEFGIGLGGGAAGKGKESCLNLKDFLKFCVGKLVEDKEFCLEVNVLDLNARECEFERECDARNNELSAILEMKANELRGKAHNFDSRHLLSNTSANKKSNNSGSGSGINNYLNTQSEYKTSQSLEQLRLSLPRQLGAVMGKVREVFEQTEGGGSLKQKGAAASSRGMSPKGKRPQTAPSNSNTSNKKGEKSNLFYLKSNSSQPSLINTTSTLIVKEGVVFTEQVVNRPHTAESRRGGAWRFANTSASNNNKDGNDSGESNTHSRELMSRSEYYERRERKAANNASVTVSGSSHVRPHTSSGESQSQSQSRSGRRTPTIFSDAGGYSNGRRESSSVVSEGFKHLLSDEDDPLITSELRSYLPKHPFEQNSNSNSPIITHPRPRPRSSSPHTTSPQILRRIQEEADFQARKARDRSELIDLINQREIEEIGEISTSSLNRVIRNNNNNSNSNGSEKQHSVMSPLTKHHQYIKGCAHIKTVRGNRPKSATGQSNVGAKAKMRLERALVFRNRKNGGIV